MVKIRNVDNGSVREVKTIDVEKLNSLIKQRDQFKAERDTLIDDLSWYKAKVSRLEQIRDIKDSALKGADIKIKTLERENEKLNKRVRKLNLNGQMQHDDLMMCDAESQLYKSFLSEISQHIGNKPSSSTYKYFRAKLDGIGIKEGE